MVLQLPIISDRSFPGPGQDDHRSFWPGFRLSSFLLTLVLGACSLAHAQSPAETAVRLAAEFQSPPVARRTGIRYWFLTDNASDEQIRREMEDIALAGFGSVEVCNKSGTLETAAWVHMMETLVRAAAEYGLHVSLTFYNDGPTSVPVEYLRSGGASMQLLSGYRELSDADFTREGDHLVFRGEIPEASSGEMGFGGGAPGGPPPGQAPAGGPPASGNALGGPPPGGQPPGGPMGQGGPPGPMGPASAGERKLIAITVARITGNRREDSGSTYSFNGARTDYTIPVIELDEHSLEVITPPDDEAAVEWSIPSGEDPSDFVMFSFYSLSGLPANPAPGAKAVVDHFSAAGAKAMFAFYDDTVFANDVLRDYFREHGGTMFEDSLELMGDPLWTPAFLQEFRERRGYDLNRFMPVLINRFYKNLFSQPAEGDVRFGFADASDRLIANDVNELLDTLYQQYHLKPVGQWVHERGLTWRAQAYNGRETGHHDTIQNAGLLDIIEGESLAMMEIHDGYDSFRYLAGGAHIAGHQIVSDELGAVMGGAYNLPVADLVSILNRNAAGGANAFILHGYPSQQSSGQEWPGYHAFGSMFTDPWEDRQPVWQDVRLMTDYMSRAETALQFGKARLDLAVYRDLKYVKMPFIDGDPLTSHGYSFEYLSPDVLQNAMAVVTRGVLAADGAAYKAMLFNNQTVMTPASARILKTYADAGLPLVFVGDIPSEVPYYLDAVNRRKDLQSLMEELLASENVYRVGSFSELAARLRDIGVLPAARFTNAANSVVLHRSRAGAVDLFWFYNKGDAPESLEVTLAGSGKPYALDLWTGRIVPLAQYSEGAQGVRLPVRVAPGTTSLVALTDAPLAPRGDLHVVNSNADGFRYDAAGRIVARSARGGTVTAELSDGRSVAFEMPTPPAPLSLADRPWLLTIESWSKDAGDPNGMVKTKSVQELGRLMDWTRIRGLETVSGRATYETRFELKDWPPDSGAWLRLQTGHGTAAVTRIVLNGTELPAPDQTSLTVDASGYFVPGTNTLEVELATVLYNTVFQTPRYEYGLTDIQLMPYTEQLLSATTRN